MGQVRVGFAVREHIFDGADGQAQALGDLVLDRTLRDVPAFGEERHSEGPGGFRERVLRDFFALLEAAHAGQEDMGAQ